MAGTLTISTLSDGTNSTSSTNCIQGSAKAWVNFNGTTSPGTIRAQYNISSVTKNGTGDYTVNFTNALADANYASLAICSTTVGGGTAEIVCQMNTQTGGNTFAPTTTACRFLTSKSGSGALDTPYVNFSAVR